MKFLRELEMTIVALIHFILAEASEDGLRKSIQIPDIGLFGVRLCQNQTKSLACPENRVIQFVDAFYSKTAGNSRAGTCADDSTCRSKVSHYVMHKQYYSVCARQRTCDVGIQRRLVTCPGAGTYKATYAEIIYTCVNIEDFRAKLPAVRTNYRKVNYVLSAEEWIWTTRNEFEKLQKLEDDIQKHRRVTKEKCQGGLVEDFWLMAKNWWKATLTAELSRKLEYSEKALAYMESHIAAAYEKVSWICQTGNVSCEGNCGGRDDSGVTYTNYVVDISFHPRFTEVPKVTLAINMLWTKSTGKEDHWGFTEEVKEVSVSGFKAYLWAWDSLITWHGATWIACGKA